MQYNKLRTQTKIPNSTSLHQMQAAAGMKIVKLLYKTTQKLITHQKFISIDIYNQRGKDSLTHQGKICV
jgi:hypothetical protein